MFVLIGALTVAIVWQLRAPDHDPRADAIRRKGYPVTLAELNAWYGSTSPDQNAALIYTNAFAHLTGLTNFLDGWIPKRGEPIHPDDLAELTMVLETNREALRLMHSAVSRTNSRYPIDLRDGFDTLLPHLADVKRATVLLTSEALVHIAEQRNDQAVESFLAAGRLADSLSEEPIMISQLVRFAAWTIVCMRVELALNATTFSNEQLEALQRMVVAAEKPRCFTRAMVAEQAYGYAVFTERKSQGYVFAVTGMNGWRSIGPRLYIGFLKAAGIFSKDKTFFLDSIATNVAITELPFPQQFKASQNTPAPVPPSTLYVVSRILLSGPTFPRETTRHGNHTAWLRITQSALAVERYRLANTNCLPDDLGQLVPKFLSAVPADPYDGNPLRFKKLNIGFIVYSIGENCRDDGGAPFNTKGGASDITITVGK